MNFLSLDPIATQTIQMIPPASLHFAQITLAFSSSFCLPWSKQFFQLFFLFLPECSSKLQLPFLSSCIWQLSQHHWTWHSTPSPEAASKLSVFLLLPTPGGSLSTSWTLHQHFIHKHLVFFNLCHAKITFKFGGGGSCQFSFSSLWCILPLLGPLSPCQCCLCLWRHGWLLAFANEWMNEGSKFWRFAKLQFFIDDTACVCCVENLPQCPRMKVLTTKFPKKFYNADDVLLGFWSCCVNFSSLGAWLVSAGCCLARQITALVCMVNMLMIVCCFSRSLHRLFVHDLSWSIHSYLVLLANAQQLQIALSLTLTHGWCSRRFWEWLFSGYQSTKCIFFMTNLLINSCLLSEICVIISLLVVLCSAILPFNIIISQSLTRMLRLLILFAIYVCLFKTPHSLDAVECLDDFFQFRCLQVIKWSRELFDLFCHILSSVMIYCVQVLICCCQCLEDLHHFLMWVILWSGGAFVACCCSCHWCQHH